MFCVSAWVDVIALIIINPNDNVSHMIAGTNASQINSLILKLSSSPPSMLDHATNLNVNSGANIAYIQSFTALTMSNTANAITSIPNTINMSKLTIDECTICNAAPATSTKLSILVILSNLNIEYPYTTNGPKIPPDVCKNSLGVIQSADGHVIFFVSFRSFPVLSTVILLGIDLSVSNHAEFHIPMVSCGIVMTDAVTTLAIDTVHCTNHQVKGTIRIPSASFGSITL